MKKPKQETRCLKCQKIFKTPDPKCIRICSNCKEENLKEPKEYRFSPPTDD